MDLARVAEDMSWGGGGRGERRGSSKVDRTETCTRNRIRNLEADKQLSEFEIW
jgi:hypothetical protein